jgi:hypothetical protein
MKKIKGNHVAIFWITSTTFFLGALCRQIQSLKCDNYI